MGEELKNSWVSLTANYSSDHLIIDNLWNEIKEAYSGPGRFYHTLQHIYTLLEFSNEFQHEIEDKEVVDFAIWYHDIVYQPRRGDNEVSSAQLAENRLIQLRLDPSKIELVSFFIVATKDHDLKNKDNQNDLALFLDFDMSVLASDWQDYKQYAADIRNEYNEYPDQLYNLGRSGFLQSVLGKDHIFHTSIFRKLEAKARENMKLELKLLEER